MQPEDEERLRHSDFSIKYYAWIDFLCIKEMIPNTADDNKPENEGDWGTLESGKLADMVLIDGNPLAEISDLLEVVLVVRDGRVVVDKQ